MRRAYPPVEEMLFFNVSVVADNEEVSLAELHLHRRRIAKIHGSYHKRFLPLPYRVVLYQVQPNSRHKVNRDARTMKLASLPVSYTTKSGWHTLDVTAVLRELLINAQGEVELLLGVQFEAPKGVAKSYTPLVPLKHFLKPAGNSGPDNPYKASSYLVVFSDIDPYFDEFDEADPPEEPETENEIPDGHLFRERHLKHKIFKVNSNDVLPEKKQKEVKKYKTMDNEVYKTDYGRGKEDVVRHKSKHRIAEVKRSKADEMALQQKNKLKTLPFLHTNEVEEIRQTSRRLTRSIDSGNGSGAARNSVTGHAPKPKDVRRILNQLIKVSVG
ncbi:UNVERIFIED_CONTAM: hypothetical protein PYX00_003039 [Menopon gallinae]|uniref:TGF-beta propeptide domain-containing protein n=1 Tax=Menopon gallinae TaxID=328185 RepID=A0AAW2I045_9NEOP